MSNENHAETIQRLALAAVDYGSIQVLPDGRTLVFRPSGPGQAEVKDLTLEHQKEPPKPKFITAGPCLQTVDALIEYVNLFKTGDTVIFADSENENFNAVIDYHKKSSLEAGLLRHSAHLDLPVSTEFRTWLQIDGAWMEQKKFARFIE